MIMLREAVKLAKFAPGQNSLWRHVICSEEKELNQHGSSIRDQTCRAGTGPSVFLASSVTGNSSAVGFVLWKMHIRISLV